MIIDKLENAKKYYGLHPNIEKGLKYLENTNLKETPDGKHIIEADTIYANVQTGNTKDPETTPWEIHKIYTDIQYIINGAEIMGWANKESFNVTESYNSDKDIAFGIVANKSFVTVPQGYFVIFTPEDAHQPMLRINSTEEVKKVIIKVKC